jgi:alginate O-acetyltransferase complex protein AlgI
MVFSSSYFIFLFLPLALALCLAVPRAAYLPATLAASLLFYFWSSGPDTAILLAIIAGNWLGGLWLARSRSPLPLAALVAANLLVLAVFKYADFIAREVDPVLGSHLQAFTATIALPVGISFFVFQAISYVVDIRRGVVAPERDPIVYGAYQAFFPHLIAGPIVRFRDVLGDLRAPRRSIEDFASGASRFAHGLFKKTVVADGIAPIANAVFDAPAGGIGFAAAWIGATAFALQIYFDFSGYSDMAIGLARMLGIRFLENFERPYASRSVTEFWRRWHVSLSSWFRDYLYVPLGGSRGGRLATCRNLLLVFAATGLWHGAAWTFLLWGLYHGAFLVIERLAAGRPVERLRHGAWRFLYCLPVVIFGWVLFRAASLDQAATLWAAMLSFRLEPATTLVWSADLAPYSVAALLLGLVVFVLPGRASLGSRLSAEATGTAGRLASLGYTAAALAVSGTIVLTGTYSPFLYFRF